MVLACWAVGRLSARLMHMGFWFVWMSWLQFRIKSTLSQLSLLPIKSQEKRRSLMVLLLCWLLVWLMSCLMSLLELETARHVVLSASIYITKQKAFSMELKCPFLIWSSSDADMFCYMLRSECSQESEVEGRESNIYSYKVYWFSYQVIKLLFCHCSLRQEKGFLIPRKQYHLQWWQQLWCLCSSYLYFFCSAGNNLQGEEVWWKLCYFI